MFTVQKSPPSQAIKRHVGARRWALVAVALGVVMDLLDTSIVTVAVPNLSDQLGAGPVAVEWVLVGYSLAFAAALLIGGRLGDLLGYRTIFLWSTTAFAGASLAAGLAPGPGALVAARVAQGVAAALMVPQTTSLVQRMYAPSERSKVMGILGAMAGLAAAAGPLVGGLLLKVDLGGDEWRLIFAINLPVAIISLVLGARLLPGGRSTRLARLDVTGALTSAVGFGLIVLGLTEGADKHWPAWTWGVLVAGVVVLGQFCRAQVRRNRQGQASVLVTAMFGRRSFSAGLVLTILTEITFAGLMLTLTLALQNGLGFSAEKSGLSTLPMIVGMVLGAAILAEVLVPRIGRYAITLAAVLLAAGAVSTALVVRHASVGHWPWQLAAGLFLAGVGLGLLMGPLFAVTLQDVHRDDAGAASGTVKSAEQLGAVFGVTVLGAAYFTRAQSHGYASAFDCVVVIEVVLLALIAILSLAVPRSFKTEEELGLDV